MNGDDERHYKRHFQPKEWVPTKEAEFARELYTELYEEITQAEREGYNTDHLYVRYKALEVFCSDGGLKDVWLTKTRNGHDSYMIISSFTGIFFGYYFRPQITETERNKRLLEIDALLKKVRDLAMSDTSVYQYVSHGLSLTHSAFLEDYSKANEDKGVGDLPTCYPPSASSANIFISRLRENISKCKLKTHVSFPRSISDKRKAERVYFIHQFSDFVRYIYSYQRSNHAMTARILNKIRPDLGTFTSDNVRQVDGPDSKAKLPNKKRA